MIKYINVNQTFEYIVRKFPDTFQREFERRWDQGDLQRWIGGKYRCEKRGDPLCWCYQ